MWALLAASLHGRWTVKSSVRDSSGVLLMHSGMGGQTVALARIVKSGPFGDDFRLVHQAQWHPLWYPPGVRPRAGA